MSSVTVYERHSPVFWCWTYPNTLRTIK